MRSTSKLQKKLRFCSTVPPCPQNDTPSSLQGLIFLSRSPLANLRLKKWLSRRAIFPLCHSAVFRVDPRWQTRSWALRYRWPLLSAYNCCRLPVSGIAPKAVVLSHRVLLGSVEAPKCQRSSCSPPPHVRFFSSSAFF